MLRLIIYAKTENKSLLTFTQGHTHQKTKQNKTKQNKTKQKTKQKTKKKTVECPPFPGVPP